MTAGLSLRLAASVQPFNFEIGGLQKLCRPCLQQPIVTRTSCFEQSPALCADL